MAGYIGARSVSLSATVANAQDVTATDTTPEVTIINNTHEDTDGGREGKVIFKGQQSGGEESTLAEIQGSHDGTSDDEKGDLIFKTNDGSDGASPTERLRIDSNGSILTATLGTDNVHLGEGAGASIASGGNNNVTIGKDAGKSINTGTQNTIVGALAGDALTTGGLVAVGYAAGSAVQTGVGNVFMGELAGTAVTSNNNTAVGSQALSSAVSGHSNASFGHDAARLTTGSRNTCLGNDAGAAATSIDDCVLIGSGAGGGATLTGHDNIMVGSSAGSVMTSGAANVFIGHQSGVATTTSSENVAIGFQTMYVGDSGGTNTAVGGQALNKVTGFDNSVLGFAAGYEITSGHNNLCLGHNAGRSSSPSGSITTGNDIICLGDDDISSLFCADTSISSSDSRDKADITNFTIGLNWVKDLRPVTYRWDKRSWYGTDEEPYGTPDGSKKKTKVNIGFLAQEALEVEKANGFGDSADNMLVCNLTEDGQRYGMKYERLVPILVNAIKELSAKNDALETRIAALEAE